MEEKNTGGQRSVKIQQDYRPLQFCCSTKWQLSPYVFSFMSIPYTWQGCKLCQTLVSSTQSRKDGTTQAAVSNRFVCTDYPFSLMHMIVLSTHKQNFFPCSLLSDSHFHCDPSSKVLHIQSCIREKRPCLSHHMMGLWHKIASGEDVLAKSDAD